jgi:DNA-binding MltR family transcriptional regulator
MLATETFKELTALLAELEAQTDRGAAIIAAAIVDDALSNALKSRLILTENLSDRLFSHEKNGPLANFSAKIDIAAATGTLDKELCDYLHLIRRIRNRFAHSIEPLKFSDQQITAWCQTLMNDIKKYEKFEPRKRFVFSALGIAAILLIQKDMPSLKIKPAKDDKSPEITSQAQESFLNHIQRLLPALHDKLRQRHPRPG